MRSARRLAKGKGSKKGTWSICPGCWKEIAGDDDADGQMRLTKHIGDRSANEYLYHQEDPDKVQHVTKSFWKQIMAIEKQKGRKKAREEGR